MKIEIDEEKKTIKIEDGIELEKIIQFLDKILQEEWEEYTLITTTINNYGNTTYIPYNPLNVPYNSYPWRPYWITGIQWSQSGNITNYSLNQ